MKAEEALVASVGVVVAGVVGIVLILALLTDFFDNFGKK